MVAWQGEMNEQGWQVNNTYNPDLRPAQTPSGSIAGLPTIALFAFTAAGLLYFSYFQLAPWIWGHTVPFNPDEITPWSRAWMKDRDGIELYALYAMMFLDLLLVYCMHRGWRRLSVGPARYFLALLFLAVSLAFIYSIGFHPPLSNFSGRTLQDIFARSLTVMSVVLPIGILLYYLQKYSALWSLAVAAVILIPVCFISLQPIFWSDYQYIFAPALRLLHGAGISEIYFQYDLLLSLIGLVWMKLGLDLNSFQVIGQSSYYLLLLGMFAFSRRWFLDKRLPVFLLITLVLVRIYAGMFDIVHNFQAAPLRLDLWLILLMLVYFKGACHWSAGLFCGLALLLHNNFGIIYSAAYIQLLLTLCMIDMTVIPSRPIKTLSVALTAFLKTNYRNLVFMLGCALAHFLIFRNPAIPNDFNYVGMGIGFIRIATNSFYWYAVIMSGLSFILLLKLRSLLPGNYLTAAFCLIYLAIGNSLYFFGRSHENNIINISPVLMLLFFLLLDIAGRFITLDSHNTAKPSFQRNLTVFIPLSLITVISIWYGDSITLKAALQAQNLSKGQFIYPSSISEQSVMQVINNVRSVTGDNPKVYFATQNDFLLDYYGQYTPAGYFNPMHAWISKPEFNKFLQGLVNQGYYLVVDNGLAGEVLSSIDTSGYRRIQGYVVAWK